ncbi:MAG: hypothetical protein ACM3NO_11385 [Deltaproteobacteria bacterium]
MNRTRYRMGFLLMSILIWTLGCSSQTPPPQQTAASQPAAAPEQPAAVQPASPPPAEPSGNLATTAAKPAGPAATEKHKLDFTNYSKVAVTVTLNGTWIGQWDSNISVPLDQVVAGKNSLVVELADTPKSECLLEISARRNDQDVNLLKLNFQDKAKGTYNYAFAAR